MYLAAASVIRQYRSYHHPLTVHCSERGDGSVPTYSWHSCLKLEMEGVRRRKSVMRPQTDEEEGRARERGRGSESAVIS